MARLARPDHAAEDTYGRQTNMADRIFLIDGHALIFKMYYAFLRKPMINSKGADTSILFGFTKYILELIEREKPSHLAVAFDPPGGTFRNKMYPAYKANRPPTPQLIIDSLEPLVELCGAMNIPTLVMPGFEADDVIGSMAKRCSSEGLEVFMVTPDKDYGQLIEDRIHQYKPGKAGGEDEVIGVEQVRAKYGIQTPLQVIDLLTICGDTADNVPGVKGVGEVGASKLISKYGSVKGIYDHLDELSPKQRAMFEESRGHIGLSYDLVTIKTDIDLDICTEAMKLDTAYPPLLADLFEKYEFNSLRRFLAKEVQEGEQREEVSLPTKAVTARVLTQAARKSGRCSIVAQTGQGSIFTKVGRLTLCAPDGESLLTAVGSCKDFKSLLEDSDVAKCGEDLKKLMNALAASGVELNGRLWDINLMHYILDPEKDHKLETLAKSHLGLSRLGPESGVEVTGSLFDDIEESGTDRSQEAAAALRLSDILKDSLAEAAAEDLYLKMEEPLLRVLSGMERSGIRVDIGSLREFSGHLREELVAREKTIKEMCGTPDLNVSSPKQVGEVLFDKMRLSDKPKKNANGTYSTDESTLLDLAWKHPVIDEILEFRGVKKLLSTYIEPFSNFIDPVDGKVHTTFNQSSTATGRLSSSNPNLQNIPVRSDRGKEIRKAFVPGAPEGVVLSADYSQIELRIMAHLSGDQHLVGAFKAGIDVHTATASKIFGIAPEEVSPDQRRIAKTANFGIMYGISSFGLSQRLRIGRKEAQRIINDYFGSFPSILSFIEDTKEAARENGFVETLFGRRRFIPEINSKNGTIRALAERNAVNAPIQGTSADIIKMAMTRIGSRLSESGLRSRMVLQIHDELVFDSFPEEIEALRSLVVEEMENVVELSVPLTVECNYGKNWLEAH